MTGHVLERRAGCWAACLAAAWLVPRDARAQDSPSPAPTPPLRADLTLLGSRPEAAAVQEVTTELLAREHIGVSWTTRTSFAPQDIFERGPRADDATIAVWIDLSEPEQARLYFRHSRADRFFLRSLLLPQGIDEMAREEIAHIVANAVLALGKGAGDALTRTEARTALQVPPTPDVGSATAPATRAVQGSAALLMGGRLFAHEIPLVAEASALVTVAHRLSRHPASALGGWASFGYQLATEHRHLVVETEVQAMSLRAGMVWVRSLPRRLALSLALGAGADRIHYAPRARSDGIIPAPAGNFYVPALSVWAGLDFRLAGGLALTARLCANVLLEKVHFDLHDGTRTSRILELYVFRPGAALGVAHAF